MSLYIPPPERPAISSGLLRLVLIAVGSWTVIGLVVALVWIAQAVHVEGLN